MEQAAASGPQPGDELAALPQTSPRPQLDDVVIGRPEPTRVATVTVLLRDGSAEVPLVNHAQRCGLRADLALAPDAIRLRGTVEQLERCFGVTVRMVRTSAGVEAMVPDGPVRLPRELAAGVSAVLGLDTRPAAERRE